MEKAERREYDTEESATRQAFGQHTARINDPEEREFQVASEEGAILVVMNNAVQLANKTVQQ